MFLTATPSQWRQMLSLPLEQRLAAASPEWAGHVARCQQAEAIPHVPDAEFGADLCAALAGLPFSLRQMIEPRLLGVFLISGGGASAVTDLVASVSGEVLGLAVLLNVDAFRTRTANEWATWKENTPFVATQDIRLEVRIAESESDDRVAALQFILLHELGHVLAAGKGFLPHWWDSASPAGEADYSYLPLSWAISAAGAIAPVARDDFVLREKVGFYGQAALPANAAQGIYSDLAQTQFPTLYAATNAHDDFAESLASYVHTVLLGKPHEVCIYQGGELLIRFEGFWRAERSARKAAFFAELFKSPVRSEEWRLFQSDIFHRSLELAERSSAEFLGLAPFLRQSIAGADLLPQAQALLEKAGEEQENPQLWMNLATALFSIGQREIALTVQQQALQMQRTFRIAARSGSVHPFRLLVLAAPGDLGANTPLDCLLEHSMIELVFHYLVPGQPLPAELPEHDAIFVAICYEAAHCELLAELDSYLRDWPRPVLNRPGNVPNTERAAASRILQDIPGLSMPLTHRIGRASLLQLLRGQREAAGLIGERLEFPIILRPEGSHAGRDLERLDDPAAAKRYLAACQAEVFYLSRFIDYRSPDGQFRKYRIALLAGRPFACHMAISTDWMIHYLNAGMYEDAGKRDEEARFMMQFDAFVQRHHAALEGIYRRAGLDYVCIDCAETREGELLIFEIDHAMVVHAMDCATLFPFKQEHVGKLREAFESLLYRPQNQ